MTVNNWFHSFLDVPLKRAWEASKVNWLLGFTAFGGPPVHFKILYDKFTVKLGWVEEQMYQELFSITQAISGPASTKMLYCINLIHGGTLSAVASFLLWSLPGALGMYALSVGVSNIGTTLPEPAYALLSGLNAATVGIIALAAVQLSEKAITDDLTRILVFLSAAAGLLYNALWYFPVLMFIASLATVIHDFHWLDRPVRALFRLTRRRSPGQQPEEGNIELQEAEPAGVSTVRADSSDGPQTARVSSGTPEPNEPSNARHSTEATDPRVIPEAYRLNFSWKVGTAIIASFFASFIVTMVLRGVLPHGPLLYRLFANMYLAGTIIFGGGPVVIPLLREYVVAEGWVSPRDFLIGLAIIQAFPGPNFNFAVFLGSLTAVNGGFSSVGGAVVGFLGIFLPGMVLVHGTMGIWSALRSKRWVKSGLRGINAGAVGLIYTAVYRLWQIGYIDEAFQSGTSLGNDPWWVVVTATSYFGGRWYRLSPPLAIILGAVLGLVRYGIVSH